MRRSVDQPCPPVPCLLSALFQEHLEVRDKMTVHWLVRSKEEEKAPLETGPP